MISAAIVASPEARRRLGPLGGLGAMLAGLPILVMFAGFSVDDARIIAQVAESGASSGCFCFNPPEFTDAVTPLGYAHLVGLVVEVTGAQALLVQAVLGYLAWALIVFGLGARLTRREWPWFAALVATSLPLAAWAGSGLETLFVGGLVSAGALLIERGQGGVGHALGTARLGGALALGGAAALRPELSVLGAAAVISGARAAGASAASSWRTWAIQEGVMFVLPGLVVAALRLHWFGSLLPLSFRAKEPALDAGLGYAVFALLGSGAPLLALLVGDARWRLPIAAHFVAVAFGGGDWMPLYRLAVPVLPLCMLVAARGLGRPGAPGSLRGALGLGAALLGAGLLWSRFHERAPGVRERERALIERVTPWLAPFERVATVDVGWVRAAAPEPAMVVDLGGVTDPRVAAIPGGHTSRELAPGFFAARSVDAWVFRAEVIASPPRTLADLRAVYVVDERLRRRRSDLGFVLVRTFERSGTNEVYALARYSAPALR